MFRNIRRFSRLGALGKPVRVRLQDGDFDVSLGLTNTVVRPKKFVNLENFETHLYLRDEDPVLKSISESGSVQDLFQVFDSVKPEALVTKYSTQGLVTLWNMEFMHQAARAFGNTGTEGYVGSQMDYSQDPKANRIVSHVVSHAAELNDEPLAASLYCMNRLKFDIRGEQCQTLMTELLKRRSSLDLHALARLCVILRKESLYGNIVLAEFSPLLHSYIRKMKTDEDVQLVSVAIRAAHAVMTNRAADDYVIRVKQLFDDRRGGLKWKPATLCSILNFLTEQRRTIKATKVLTEMAAKILRRAGNMLIPHVRSMKAPDVVSILKVLEFEHEPAPLIEALNQRLSKIVQESKKDASIHFLALTRPTSFEEKAKLEDFMREKLKDTVPSGQSLAALLKILQKSVYPCYNPKVFNRFWSVYEQYLGAVLDGRDGSDLREWPKHEHAADGEREDVRFGSTGPFATFIKTIVTYMHICSQMNRAYRHVEFEATASRIALQVLRSNEDGRCVITTQEYARCIAFLMATGHTDVTLKPSFLHKFRARHFMLLHLAMLLNGGYCHEIEAVLEQQFPILLTGRLGPTEYLALAKITSPAQATFRQSMRMIEVLPWSSALLAAEFLQLIKMFAFYSERSFQRVSKFMCQAGSDISWDCATEFVGASYVCGVEQLDDAVRIAARVIEKSPRKADPLITIRSMLALCYHGHLSKEFVRKVFSEEYLRHVDKHITAEPLGSKVASDLRDKFMELNRAVCIDMPEAGIRWFHGKYCQDVTKLEGPRSWSLEHIQVRKALLDIIGSPCLSKDAYSPYFHAIDFLVHVDGKGNPVPVMCKEEGVGQLAIIVHHLNSYTSGEERRLKGFHKLRRRHLEVLGYRVIEIDPFDWRRLCSSRNRAEEDYLQECIFQ